MTSRVVHFQLGAVDAEGLASFYRDVFEWNIHDARLTSLEANRSGVYHFIGDEIGVTGGVTAIGPKGVVLTVEVDDIAATLERVEASGGSNLVDVDPEHLQLKGAGDADGTFAMHGFVDPEGNQVQILQR